MNEAIASRKTRVDPARMPGRLSGNVMRKKAATGPAPSERAASSTVRSTFSIAPTRGRIMNGRKMWTRAMVTPRSVPSMTSGSRIRPQPSRVSLTRPWSPSTTSQPIVRTTMLVSSGAMTSAVSGPRQRERLRARP